MDTMIVCVILLREKALLPFDSQNPRFVLLRGAGDAAVVFLVR
jgi:hypothetical protein